MLKTKWPLLLFTLLINENLIAELITGDVDSNSSFSFSVRAHGIFIPQGRFFVGASEKVPGNNFAVSAAIRNELKFTGLTPPKVTLNNITDQDNPLNGAAIKFLVLMERKPLVIRESDGSSVYVIDDLINKDAMEVFSANNIADANGKVTPNILAITTSAPDSIILPESLFQDRIAFAAIANQNNQFDGNGSGIAVMILKVIKEKIMNQNNNEVEKNSFKFDIINAQDGQENGNKAAPLSKVSDVIKIQNAVDSISNKVDLYFDQNLRRDDKHPGVLYIAIQVRSGTNPNDGARAVILAELVNNKLIFAPIAPDTAFLTDDKIVGTRGALKNVNIDKVRTMFTTTHLHYLIVVGGNGDGEPAFNSNDTKRKVFSLPLVNNPSDPNNGKLAKADSIPINVFTENKPHKFLTRAFIEPAINPQDLLTQNSVQARIGGTENLPGDITDIQIINDTVFVSVSEAGNGLQPGIFFSEALFDRFGRIAAWTNWQRASAGGSKIVGFDLDPMLNLFWSIPENRDLTSRDVFRTSWTSTDIPLAQIAAKKFPQACGGIKGLFNFPFNTSGLSQTSGNRISFLTLTGFNRVALIQTGNDPNRFFGPSIISLQNNNFTSTNGSLAGFLGSANQIYISGGALEIIANINSADIISDGISGWLAVGGSQGLAILSKTDGSGWNAISGLGKNFNGLTEDMSFKIIDSYSNIKKIISNKNNLFVLTSQKLDKIEINKSAIFSNNFKITTLAQTCNREFSNTLSFSDMIVCPPLILLATSSGLFRSSNDIDISIVNFNNAVNWTTIPLPESIGSLDDCGPVTRLFSISKTGFETDTINDGNVFILNAYTGFELAQIYRLSLNKGSISLFPDYFIGLEVNGSIIGKNSYFVNLEQYRNYVVTDGAIIAVSQSALASENPKFNLLPTRLKSGQRFGARDSIRINLNIPDAHTIGRSERDSATGNWIVPGDFGLRINQ